MTGKMAGFSSCYFCGTVLDAPVEDRPVVPDGLGTAAGSRRTVTLCSSCNRKLDAVMDEVREAIRRADNLEPKQESGGADNGGGGEPSAQEFFDESPTIRDLSDQTSEADGRTRDAGRGTEPDTARSSPDRAPDEGASDAEDDGGGSDAEDDDGGSDAEHDVGASDAEHDDGGSDAEQDVGASDAEHDEGAPGKVSVRESGAEDADEAEGPESGGGGDSDEVEDAEDDNQSLTPLENSKVMRMLENRAFPVERAPFESVAANAYEVRPSDVGKVIDMAIDRDLLAEEDGTLVRPE